jgi:peptidoglycan hydrolase-like protein with peptidoglycan-binding domain
MKKKRAPGIAVLAASVLCLLGTGSPARAAKWQDNWPVLTQMKSGEYDGAGFSVQIAQYLLRARGYKLAVDGHFGPKSVEATRRFQRSRGLPATGVLKAATWQKLVVRVQQGSRGDAVRAVQIVLYETQPSVPVDGVFGPVTRRAVVALQRESQLTPDGVVGPVTWQRLLRDMYD